MLRLALKSPLFTRHVQHPFTSNRCVWYSHTFLNDIGNTHYTKWFVEGNDFSCIGWKLFSIRVYGKFKIKKILGTVVYSIIIAGCWFDNYRVVDKIQLVDNYQHKFSINVNSWWWKKKSMSSKLSIITFVTNKICPEIITEIIDNFKYQRKVSEEMFIMYYR